jgi:hypothetical protein
MILHLLHPPLRHYNSYYKLTNRHTSNWRQNIDWQLNSGIAGQRRRDCCVHGLDTSHSHETNPRRVHSTRSTFMPTSVFLFLY